MLIIGVDPGTRHLGYGLIRVDGTQGEAVDFGVLHMDPKKELSHRLFEIYDTLQSLVQKHHPDVMAVEEAFVYKNAKTALTLGHGRGVVLLVAALLHIQVAEYAPRDIKKAVTGNGAASKQQVQWMVSQMLHIPENQLEEDAADGLAVALCHALRWSQDTAIN